MTDADPREEQTGRTKARAERASTESDSLAATLLSVVRRPLFRDTFQTLFACQLLEASPGWPRLVTADGPVPQVASVREGAQDWLREGDVLVELTRSPGDEPFALGLSLSSDSAARLVDAQLGGRFASSLAAAAGQLSEAECGVLAYAAARLLAASGLPFGLRDVRPAHARDVTSARIVWPLALQTSAGPLDLALWFPPALADGPAVHLLELTLHESADRDALAGIRPGDVWLSESSSLTLTSEGLTGPVVLSVADIVTRLSGQLRRAHVRARAPWHGARTELARTASAGTASTESRTSVELVLGRRALSLLQLAELASGFALRADGDHRELAWLRSEGVMLARGTLISFRGSVGLRVDELPDELPDQAPAQRSASTAASTSANT